MIADQGFALLLLLDEIHDPLENGLKVGLVQGGVGIAQTGYDVGHDVVQSVGLAREFAEKHARHAANPRIGVDDAQGNVRDLSLDFDHVVEDQVTEDVERRPFNDGRIIA